MKVVNTPRIWQRLALDIRNSKRRYGRFMRSASVRLPAILGYSYDLRKRTCHGVRAVANNPPRLNMIMSPAL